MLRVHTLSTSKIIIVSSDRSSLCDYELLYIHHTTQFFEIFEIGCGLFQEKQARKLKDAQAEKLTSLQANKLTSW